VTGEAAFPVRCLQVVIDTDCINDNLPRSIEAIFYPSACGRGSQCRRDAEQVHQTFRREFGLSAEKSPLVRLDTSNWEEPFSKAGAID
jgi:hypothetical protein